jgi:hypothetical protein
VLTQNPVTTANMKRRASDALSELLVKKPRHSDEKRELLQAPAATTSKQSPRKPVSSAMDAKESTSRAPTAKKASAEPSVSQHLAPRNRFQLSTPEERAVAAAKREAEKLKAVERRKQASKPLRRRHGVLKPAAKKVLADKTNTQRPTPAQHERTSTKPCSKQPSPTNIKKQPVAEEKGSAESSTVATVKQPIAAEKRPFPAQPVASKKRGLDEDDDFTSKPAKKQQRHSLSRTPEREDSIPHGDQPESICTVRDPPLVDDIPDSRDDSEEESAQPKKTANTKATIHKELSEKTAPARDTSMAPSTIEPYQVAPANTSTGQLQRKKGVAQPVKPPKQHQRKRAPTKKNAVSKFFQGGL